MVFCVGKYALVIAREGSNSIYLIEIDRTSLASGCVCACTRFDRMVRAFLTVGTEVSFFLFLGWTYRGFVIFATIQARDSLGFVFCRAFRRVTDVSKTLASETLDWGEILGQFIGAEFNEDPFFIELEEEFRGDFGNSITVTFVDESYIKFILRCI